MIDTMLPDSQGVYADWLRMVSSVVRGQWQLLDAQFQAGLDFLKKLADDKKVESEAKGATPPNISTPPGSLADLETRALERVRKGFPPPPEVYQVQNRSRIDWSRFPEWAWPIDPDLFTGTSHEG
jgi:hypothetical protein